MAELYETFSVLLSIYAFLNDIKDESYPTLPIYMNEILTLPEREAIADESHYLRVYLRTAEINVDQKIDLNFHLVATNAHDPTTFWMKKFPYNLMQRLMNTKTDMPNSMVALYDYDALVGEAALNAFYQDATLPSTLSTIAQKRFPDVQHFNRFGGRIGLKFLPSAFAPTYELDAEPMIVTWSMTASYHESRHQKAVRGGVG